MLQDASGVCAEPATCEVKPMMPIEHQVCSHELATRLAALGVRQESVFWWVDRTLTYTGGRASHAPLQGGGAAFTVAELGAMLPDDITIPSKNGKPRAHTHWLRFGRYRVAGNRFWCVYPGGSARTRPYGRKRPIGGNSKATCAVLYSCTDTFPV